MWQVRQAAVRALRAGSASFGMQGEPCSDAVERLVEVFQGDGWSGGDAPATDLIDLYRITCHARSCPMLDIDAAAIDAVRCALAELTARWAALPVGGRLEVGFVQAFGEPERKMAQNFF